VHAVKDAATGRPDGDSRTRILASARTDLERRGILGLRVADVARGANTSITLIYRHFTDRDGLLAAVLGDIYDERAVYWESIVQGWEGKVVSYDDLVAVMPSPDDPATQRVLSLQIFATAMNNPELKARVDAATRRFHTAVQRGVEMIRKQSGERNPLDPRIYSLMLLMFNTMFVSNDALGERRITEPEYREFLHHFFARYDAPA
jgi:AcrR family transcriptional regulator